VIQEAAHEDANIIFGAVVDPKLGGKVKITVIATGFDRDKRSRTLRSTAVQTPVDLQHYAAQVTRAVATDGVEQPAMETRAVAPEAVATPPLTLSRRPGLELALPALESVELSSPLDVPAFLRRQS
jgi:cell division protein FtsZ